MTYHPDSVLVEKVAEARWQSKWHVRPWTEVFGVTRQLALEEAEFYLRVACPLVAGVIADRLDEEAGGDSKDRWAATFVRSEFVDGEA